MTVGIYLGSDVICLVTTDEPVLGLDSGDEDGGATGTRRDDVEKVWVALPLESGGPLPMTTHT